VEDRRSRLPTEAEIADIKRKASDQHAGKTADLLFVFGTREDVGAARG